MLFSGIPLIYQSCRQCKSIFYVSEPSSMVEYLKNQMSSYWGECRRVYSLGQNQEDFKYE